MAAELVAELHRLARDLDAYTVTASNVPAAPLGLGTRLAQLDRALAPLAAESAATHQAAVAAALRLQLDAVAQLLAQPAGPGADELASAVAALRRLAAALLAAAGS